MARGFDSKFVEAQQEDATRGQKIGPSLTPEQRDVRLRRHTLELSKVRAEADLSRATVPAHKQMLEQAIRALEAQLAALD